MTINHQFLIDYSLKSLPLKNELQSQVEYMSLLNLGRSGMVMCLSAEHVGGVSKFLQMWTQMRF